jgi:hypothetical protein
VVFAAVVLPEVTSPEAALTESDRKLGFPAVFSGVLTRRGSLECAHAQPEGGSHFLFFLKSSSSSFGHFRSRPLPVAPPGTTSENTT